MECPFCNNIMRKGVIYGKGDMGIPWLPDGIKQPKVWSRSMAGRCGGRYLADVVYFRGASATTRLCTSCHKAMVEYSDRK